MREAPGRAALEEIVDQVFLPLARRDEIADLQVLQGVELGGFEPPTSWVRSRRFHR
jgi:hypothetical protein